MQDVTDRIPALLHGPLFRQGNQSLPWFHPQECTVSCLEEMRSLTGNTILCGETFMGSTLWPAMFWEHIRTHTKTSISDVPCKNKTPVLVHF